MEKLELKHLAPYLPYRLMVIDRHHEFCKKIINNQLKDYKYKGVTPVELTELSSAIELSRRYTPLLHPLSRLTDPILDGNTPIDWLQDEYFTLTLHEQCKRILEDERWINHCDWLLIQHLFEWHFDVFGLIEKGLAIEKEAKTILKELE